MTQSLTDEIAIMARKPKDKQQEAEIADDVLIREVDDELRAEKLQAWWQRFGSMLVGACVVIVIATIAYQIASSYKSSSSSTSTFSLLKVVCSRYSYSKAAFCYF